MILEINKYIIKYYSVKSKIDHPIAAVFDPIFLKLYKNLKMK